MPQAPPKRRYPCRPGSQIPTGIRLRSSIVARRLSGFKNLARAIENATGSTGKVPDHQRRVGRQILKKACGALLAEVHQIKACTSFDALFHLVERLTADIHRFGELAVYDTSLRLGAWLNKLPKKVYLHAGTRKGAKALGLDVSRGHVEMNELPKTIKVLKPWQAEDFLCIYKDAFASRNSR